MSYAQNSESNSSKLKNMELNSEYGILIDKSDDKKFIMNFKEVFGRSLSKSESESMLEARLPFVFKYFYFDFEKANGLYIELEPNEDENGILQYPKRPDYGWILRTKIRDDFNHVDKEKVINQTRTNLESLSFKIEFIKHQE
ncbi:hypothetical protein [Snuella sedimenti]|uniref:Uncharacterized protein n=1 Tax=Snuella sedimenti TaxID=2798802 RepID=A0A8J7IG03_9FLAO|nr:hypothetical protein [Snuella sedimenti]MBJ6368582.1 hypothetical protein [Snuella sedimenti]